MEFQFPNFSGIALQGIFILATYSIAFKSQNVLNGGRHVFLGAGKNF